MTPNIDKHGNGRLDLLPTPPIQRDALIATLVESLKLADLVLSGANMNKTVVHKSIQNAIALGLKESLAVEAAKNIQEAIHNNKVTELKSDIGRLRWVLTRLEVAVRTEQDPHFIAEILYQARVTLID
jgi:hypothetical protein